MKELDLYDIELYTTKEIFRFLRCNFSLPKNIKYTFDDLLNFHKIVCEKKNVNFDDYVEKDDTNKIYAIYPILDCGEKLVWISILHKFGNLCFAKTRLTVDAVLSELRCMSVIELAEEYDISAETIVKVSKEYEH